MIKMKTILLLVILFTTTGLCWSASNLPEYYPKRFENEGILHEVKHNKVIINATAYQLVDNVIVHTLSTQYGSLNNLRKDMDIAFRLMDTRVITEIWILPKGSVELE